MAVARKERKIIRRHAYEALFDADVLLVVCKYEDFFEAASEMIDKPKREHLKEMLDKKGPYSGYTLATQFPMPGGGSVIWANPSADVGTLLHEVVHAAHYLLAKRDSPLTADTEELYARVVEFLFRRLTSS